MQLTGDHPAGPVDRRLFGSMLDGLPDPAWMLDSSGALLDLSLSQGRPITARRSAGLRFPSSWLEVSTKTSGAI
jgi:hypothetical protein